MFEPTWPSLRQHTIPEWFRDAKFGIWAHWGAQSVARSGDWYARHLYGLYRGSESWEHRRALSQEQHHRTTFGDPSTVGYKDVVHRWKAEAFDPDRLINIFKSSGARYFMSMAVHCDNVDLWDSKHQPWNTVRVGPQQNIVKAWEHAARGADLPFGLSFHNNWTWRWLESAHDHDGRLRAADGEGQWWQGLDPQDLYLPPHEPGTPPTAAVVENFYRRVRDAIDQHRPDLIYFDDSRLPFDSDSILPGDPTSTLGLEFLADYYNQSQLWSGGATSGLASIKAVPDEDRYAVLLDSERHQLDTLQEAPWQFDSSDGEWFDCQREDNFFHPRKTTRQVIHTLIDVVSKNGTLLLNIPQRADGTIDEHSQRLLAEVGDWLTTAGEAIYATRPWTIFGEGNTQIDTTALYNEEDLPFTAEDIRFTTSGNTLYAFLLAWPADNIARITSLGTATRPDTADRPRSWPHRIDLLGSSEPLAWQQTPTSLDITLPDRPGTQHAHVLRIQ